MKAIRERVHALARSHTLTVNAYSENKGIVFEALIRAVLEPYGDQSAAFPLDGPPIRLPSRAGNALALALHELATNAAKYGSLSRSKGRVAIRWRIQDDERTDLHFSWTERGGPPIEGEPERQSLGTRMIDRLVEAQESTVERKWKREGVEVTIHMPTSPTPTDAMPAPSS